MFLSSFPEKQIPIFGNCGHCVIFLEFTKLRVPRFHAKPTDEWPEISHMRPIYVRKLKLKIDPFSRPHKKIEIAAKAQPGVGKSVQMNSTISIHKKLLAHGDAQDPVLPGQGLPDFLPSKI